MTSPRVVAQRGGSAFLIHVGDVEVASGRLVPRARVFDRDRRELFDEMYLDSIVKFGYWVEFEGSDEEREAIEAEVRDRLDATVISEALILLRERAGWDDAIAHLREKLGVGDGQAREILAVASAPDPRALAGRV
jgi:hypothetical protein